MSEYIYNQSQTLRTTLTRVHRTAVKLPNGSPGFFVVVKCEDKGALNTWEHERVYCGVVTSADSTDEIRGIMNYGGDPQPLSSWLSEAYE